jgi:hypothetical protein
MHGEVEEGAAAGEAVVEVVVAGRNGQRGNGELPVGTPVSALTAAVVALIVSVSIG